MPTFVQGPGASGSGQYSIPVHHSGSSRHPRTTGISTALFTLVVCVVWFPRQLGRAHSLSRNSILLPTCTQASRPSHLKGGGGVRQALGSLSYTFLAVKMPPLHSG